MGWAISLTDVLSGWSNGYDFIVNKNQEDEVRQGKDHRLAAIYQASQVGPVSNLVYEIAEKMPPTLLNKSVKILCTVVPFLSFPFCYALGVVRSDNFTTKHISKDGRVYQSLHFLAEHLGDLMRVAMVVSSVALIAIGAPFVGGMALTAMTYEVADNYLGLVPFKISLFMETYMPIVSLSGMVLGGNYFTRIFSVIQLTNYLYAPLNNFLLRKIDLLMQKVFATKGPTLEEIDGPVEEKKKLTYQEMVDFLNAADCDFEINVPHCSKWTFDYKDLPSDNDFHKFMNLFKEVNWTEKYTYIKAKLRKDKIFVDFIGEKSQSLPGFSTEKFKRVIEQLESPVELSIEEKDSSRNEYGVCNLAVLARLKKTKTAALQQTFEAFIDQAIKQLAKEKGLSKEAYLAEYLEGNMETLIQGISDAKRMKGSQIDVSEAMANCALILPYLQTLDRQTEKTDFEDVLLSLAVDGGDYCARGVKRTSFELLKRVLYKDRPPTEFSADEDYERVLKQSLQDQREKICEAMYQKITRKILPKEIAEDPHGMDIYRQHLALGFFPLTPHERNSVGPIEFYLWKMYQKFRDVMYQRYRNVLDDAVKATGEVNFGNYMRAQIMQNERLSEEQKNKLLEMYTERNKGHWDVDITNELFHRLALVMLGVLNYNDPLKKSEPAPPTLRERVSHYVPFLASR